MADHQELIDNQQVDEYEAHVITDWKTVAGVPISSRGTGGNQATNLSFPVVKPGECSYCFSGSSVKKQDGKEWDSQEVGFIEDGGVHVCVRPKCDF